MAKKHVKESDAAADGMATSYTRTGVVNMTNRKPFRTESQKRLARQTAKKVRGTWVSDAPVSYHPEFKE